MDKYYWNTETEEVETLSAIMESYDREKTYMAFGDGSPEAFLECSMWYNNGALYPLDIKINLLQAEYDRKRDIGYRYGFELVDEELDDLRETLYKLNQLYLET